MSKFGEAFAKTMLVVGMGSGIGYGIEGVTNEKALGRVETVEICMDELEVSSAVNNAFISCVTEEIEGRDHVEEGVFQSGDSPESIQRYIDKELREADEVELFRVVLWGVGAGAAYAYFWDPFEEDEK